jgi:hypothetical protein
MVNRNMNLLRTREGLPGSSSARRRGTRARSDLDRAGPRPTSAASSAGTCRGCCARSQPRPRPPPGAGPAPLGGAAADAARGRSRGRARRLALAQHRSAGLPRMLRAVAAAAAPAAWRWPSTARRGCRGCCARSQPRPRPPPGAGPAPLGGAAADAARGRSRGRARRLALAQHRSAGLLREWLQPGAGLVSRRAGHAGCVPAGSGRPV